MKRLILISLLIIPLCKAADVGDQLSKIQVRALLPNAHPEEKIAVRKIFSVGLKVNLKKETIGDLSGKILDKISAQYPELKHLFIDQLSQKSPDHMSDTLLDENGATTLHEAGISEASLIKADIEREYSEYIKGGD